MLTTRRVIQVQPRRALRHARFLRQVDEEGAQRAIGRKGMASASSRARGVRVPAVRARGSKPGRWDMVCPISGVIQIKARPLLRCPPDGRAGACQGLLRGRQSLALNLSGGLDCTRLHPPPSGGVAWKWLSAPATHRLATETVHRSFRAPSVTTNSRAE